MCVYENKCITSLFSHRVHFAHIRLGKLVLVDTEINNIKNSTFDFLYRPLDNIMYILQHQKSNIDFLKLDVEGQEWDIFEESIFKVFRMILLCIWLFIYLFVLFSARGCVWCWWEMWGLVFFFFIVCLCIFLVIPLKNVYFFSFLQCRFLYVVVVFFSLLPNLKFISMFKNIKEMKQRKLHLFFIDIWNRTQTVTYTFLYKELTNINRERVQILMSCSKAKCGAVFAHCLCLLSTFLI